MHNSFTISSNPSPRRWSLPVAIHRGLYKLPVNNLYPEVHVLSYICLLIFGPFKKPSGERIAPRRMQGSSSTGTQAAESVTLVHIASITNTALKGSVLTSAAMKRQPRGRAGAFATQDSFLGLIVLRRGLRGTCVRFSPPCGFTLLPLLSIYSSSLT